MLLSRACDCAVGPPSFDQNCLNPTWLLQMSFCQPQPLDVKLFSPDSVSTVTIRGVGRGIIAPLMPSSFLATLFLADSLPSQLNAIPSQLHSISVLTELSAEFRLLPHHNSPRSLNQFCLTQCRFVSSGSDRQCCGHQSADSPLLQVVLDGVIDEWESRQPSPVAQRFIGQLG